MTGKTHRAGGVLAAIVGFTMLQNKGLIFDNINPLLQFTVMYPITYWGSSASDLDHNPDSCPSHDIVSVGINRLLHITTPVYQKLEETLSGKQKKNNLIYKLTKTFSANHRSWQTHSIELLLVLLFVLKSLFDGVNLGFSDADVIFLSLILIGLTLGLLSHLVLDLITPLGIKIAICSVINQLFNMNLPDTIHLVPNVKFFATGGTWETIIYRLLNIVTVLYLIYIMIQGTNILPFEINIY